MLEDLDLYKEHPIICNKLTAAVSDTAATTECYALFRDIKLKLHCHTDKNLPPDVCATKRFIVNLKSVWPESHIHSILGTD